jgi:hypothetical protein
LQNAVSQGVQIPRFMSQLALLTSALATGKGGIEAITLKLILLGSVVVIIIVAAAAIAGATLTQKGRSSHVYTPADGDSDVVAIVEGREITRGDIREPADWNRNYDPSLSENAALQIGIVIVVNDRALDAEVERRDLVPTVSTTAADNSW